MTPEALKTLGKVLCALSPHYLETTWKSQLARDSGCTRMTIHRYLNGYPIPKRRAKKFRRLMLDAWDAHSERHRDLSQMVNSVIYGRKHISGWGNPTHDPREAQQKSAAARLKRLQDEAERT